MKMILIGILWVACGYVNWGLTMGNFSHQFPDANHIDISGFMAVMGPIGLVVAFLESAPQFHWQVKPYTTEQRWEFFHRSAPSLDRQYFEQHYN